MKKDYTKPFAELVEFDYSVQVVAESGNSGIQTTNIGPVGEGCTNPQTTNENTIKCNWQT